MFVLLVVSHEEISQPSIFVKGVRNLARIVPSGEFIHGLAPKSVEIAHFYIRGPKRSSTMSVAAGVDKEDRKEADDTVEHLCCSCIGNGGRSIDKCF